MITHIVQAFDSALGWVDAKTARSYLEAEICARELRSRPAPWIGGRIGRVRVVPVALSRCADRYNREEPRPMTSQEAREKLPPVKVEFNGRPIWCAVRYLDEMRGVAFVPDCPWLQACFTWEVIAFGATTGHALVTI